MLQSCTQNLPLIFDFVKKDFRARFAGSVVGIFWNVINPLVMVAIYALIFSLVMRAKLPNSGGILREFSYSIYLCAGIIPWTMFAETLLRSTNIFLENTNLIKKVSFPKEILNISALITSTINFAIAFSFFIVFLAIVNLLPSYSMHIPIGLMLLFFGVIICQQLFAFGLGLAFSALNVFFRDVGQLVNIAIQLWFWFTPIVYWKEIVPAPLQFLLKFNPMYHFIGIYQSIFYYNTFPRWTRLVAISSLTILALALGYLIFRKLSDDIPDEI
ncbi:Teichoic acid translocation permease protein TagG [subsurface metagenome]